MGGPAVINNIEYPEFDNFYECNITKYDITFHSTEQYYQYHKCALESDKNLILTSSIEYVFGVGQSVQLVQDWESIKLPIMYQANKLKFSQHKNLLDLLLSTTGDITVPSCVFGSLFWGSGIENEGENWNGKILMAIRDEARGLDIEDFLIEMKYRCFLFKMST